MAIFGIFITVYWFCYSLCLFFKLPNFIVIFSRITNNGYLSDNLPISRGIRQGDPISALIYLPVAELMATVILNNSNIKGITVGKTEIKLCQLADDTLLFLKDANSVKVALSCFEEFYRYAGLRL